MYTSKNLLETKSIASEIAASINAGDLVCFYGDLGAGKTEFIKGFCKKLEVEENATSPSFSIINEYHAKSDIFTGNIYHIDLYRLKSTQELAEIGFHDYIFDNEAIKLIEWASKAEDFLPKSRIDVTIEIDKRDINLREISISNLTKNSI